MKKGGKKGKEIREFRGRGSRKGREGRKEKINGGRASRRPGKMTTKAVFTPHRT